MIRPDAARESEPLDSGCHARFKRPPLSSPDDIQGGSPAPEGSGKPDAPDRRGLIGGFGRKLILAVGVLIALRIALPFVSYHNAARSAICRDSAR